MKKGASAAALKRLRRKYKLGEFSVKRRASRKSYTARKRTYSRHPAQAARRQGQIIPLNAAVAGGSNAVPMNDRAVQTATTVGSNWKEAKLPPPLRPPNQPPWPK